MSSLFAFLLLVALVVMIVFFVKSGKQKKAGEDNSKTKKIAFISLGCFILFFILTGVTAPDTSTNEDSSVAQESSNADEKFSDNDDSKKDESKEETAATEEKDDKSKLREDFNKSLGETTPTWYESVRNDKTGNWRELVVYSDKSIDKDLAIAYANAYFESDQEVHFIVNLYLKTTTTINKYGNMLSVTCHEYKDKEEHDAVELGAGTVLNEFTVNMDTGELVE